MSVFECLSVTVLAALPSETRVSKEILFDVILACVSVMTCLAVWTCSQCSNSYFSCTMPFAWLCPQYSAPVTKQPPKQAHTASTADTTIAFLCAELEKHQLPEVGRTC